MAINVTPNYDLKKPTGDEFFDQDTIDNDNMNKIDAQMKTNEVTSRTRSFLLGGM